MWYKWTLLQYFLNVPYVAKGSLILLWFLHRFASLCGWTDEDIRWLSSRSNIAMIHCAALYTLELSTVFESSLFVLHPRFDTHDSFEKTIERFLDMDRLWDPSFISSSYNNIDCVWIDDFEIEMLNWGWVYVSIYCEEDYEELLIFVL